ncbi:preprotein translocase subunit SecG [Hyphomicrobium sp.]|uniref:preprotein translocase subunit SecG n=1 Tax=Hyphomicrobium sp. TaxID=82 RepID=UPI002D7A2949|nr:preprotein translocase subunit SecG [Hyphomicrobium sp.]HET6387871.1 preprotein translocase subunit SecG [Hyphomicrobium sp.]
MATVLLIIHLMIAAALVAVVLLQKSEGGALGMGGGGGGGGGFLTGRGTANLLTRTTAGLAAAFFATSILLTILANHSAQRGSAFDRAPQTGTQAPATGGEAPTTEPGRGGILDKLDAPRAPLVPQNQ